MTIYKIPRDTSANTEALGDAPDHVVSILGVRHRRECTINPLVDRASHDHLNSNQQLACAGAGAAGGKTRPLRVVKVVV